MKGPLDGVRVVDLTANMSGPLATMIIADQGADVVKVEGPEGDPMRAVGSGADGYSALYANLNRSKRSIVLDLAQPSARPVLDRLLDGADVVVHNLRASAAARLRIDAAAVRLGRPQVIHVTISGFGSREFRDRRAYDHVLQAHAGFADLQREGDGLPKLVRQGVVDKVTALTAAQAIVAALFERARTGRGRELEVSMLDAAVAFLWPDGMMDHTAEAPRLVRPPISRSFELTPAADGHLAFVVLTPAQYEELAIALDIVDSDGKTLSGGALLRAVRQRLAAMTATDAVALLAAADIPVSAVNERRGLHEQPEVRAAGTIDSFDHPVLGRVRQPRPPARFDDIGGEGRRPAPMLGEHTREICSELHFDASAVDELEVAGAFGPAGTSVKV